MAGQEHNRRNKSVVDYELPQAHSKQKSLPSGFPETLRCQYGRIGFEALAHALSVG